MDIIYEVLKTNGFKSLNPLQSLALNNGLLSNKNMVIAAPTASGKTLIAEIASLYEIIVNKRKVVYIVPLKALASEKYEDFVKKYKNKIKIAISTGDFDSSDEWLENYDLIIVTSEKLDSLMRHNTSWLNKIGLVIVDEVHLLNDISRGSNLEVILTRLRYEIKPRFICLSATISNYKEIADWLNAVAIQSDYRPVKLKKGVLYGNNVYWDNMEKQSIRGEMDNIALLIIETLEKGKQVLIFVNTRKATEEFAEKITNIVNRFVNKKKMSKIAAKILNALESPTSQCRKLADCVENGVAFHHAGLSPEQRKIVEDAFKNKEIKVIVATPTLAMGVNLPSFMVIIRDLRRYEAFRGMSFLSNLEIQQMLGRAGRPRYDEYGIALLLSLIHI